ncbi:MFS transporter [Vagococcus coleopterorum]|uniref:MFS transporter n=1 Tax=Vagococcus coleopterorum TaxID=2714946 RepID=A0A6G8ANK1_9ENTE|nr:MFS transporter [Vagococcus coleopterorum]QIL46503.1 MFS transporter [Vagococcus coleopterorum]
MKKLSVKEWVTLSVILLPNLLISLNTYMLQVALPEIQTQVGASYGQAQYILSGYALGLAATLILSGKLGDVFGYKRLLIVGILGFMLVSIVGATAISGTILIVVRILQGIFGACIQPQVLVLMRNQFDKAVQPLVFSIYGVVIGLGFTFGLMLGGLIININAFDLGWRNIFIINIPFCLLILLGMRLLETQPAISADKIDWLGAGLLSSGLLLVINSLYQLQNKQAMSFQVVMIFVAVGLLVAFYLIEKQRKEKGKVVLVDLELFDNSFYSLGLASVLFVYLNMFSVFFLITYYVQSGLGNSVAETSLAFLSLGVGFILTSVSSSKLLSVVGDKLLLFGTAVMGIALLYLSQSVMLQPELLSWSNSLLLFMYGLGLGATTTPLVGIILQGLDMRFMGIGGALLNTVMYLASSLGVCAIGFFFQNSLGKSLAKASLSDYQRAFSHSLWLSAIYLVILLVIFIEMKRKKTRSTA